MSETAKTQQPSPLPFRVRCLRLWVWMLVIDAALYVMSATFMLTRLYVVFVGAWGLFTGILYLAHLHRRTQWPARVGVLLVAAIVIWAIIGGRAADTAQLRALYVTRLRAFMGTRYIWGGETHVGIDCSGLARVALYEAMALEGLREGNPRLLGPALWAFWWRDMSAKAMGEGAHGYTQIIAEDIPASRIRLRPGDLAIMGEGKHVLIYLGDEEWIEASGVEGRVGLNTATEHRVGRWSIPPVTYARWSVLVEGEEM